ncbi:glutaredoxin family protein [Candidatus Parcubacteria bacterium]|nr:MAG: glutaredoxin family protein [Candidatus Parcubacteria bacterium]
MKKVIIYSTPTCIYCRMAKDFLTDKNIPFTDYDLTKDAQMRDEVIKKTGQMAVPVIEVDGEVMIGFDEEKLSQMLGI